MADLEETTRVHALGDGRYGATLCADWEIWGPNGGYLCAIALRAAGAQAVIGRPVAFYCHYLRVAKFGPVELGVETIASGRRAESLRVTMWQGDRQILEGMLRTARPGEGLSHVEHAPMSAPHPSELQSPEALGDDYGKRHAFWRNFDVRVVQSERFGTARQKRPAHWLEWYRVHCGAGFEDPFLDAGRSALLLDTIGWPAAVQPHPEPGFIAPSLDVAVWFHGSGARSDWVLAEAKSAVAGGGCVFADGRLFAEDGSLLASSGTQMLYTPVPARA